MQNGMEIAEGRKRKGEVDEEFEMGLEGPWRGEGKEGRKRADDEGDGDVEVNMNITIGDFQGNWAR